jgi:predicted CopG family antitoxin
MATTISISQELKLKLKNLGRTGDSYEDVIRRMYELTRKSMLQAYLYDSKDSITVDEAIARAKRECQK